MSWEFRSLPSLARCASRGERAQELLTLLRDLSSCFWREEFTSKMKIKNEKGK
nr:MAG TPA: hypothetical protein [Caudoviricetes sp.]